LGKPKTLCSAADMRTMPTQALLAYMKPPSPRPTAGVNRSPLPNSVAPTFTRKNRQPALPIGSSGRQGNNRKSLYWNSPGKSPALTNARHPPCVSHNTIIPVSIRFAAVNTLSSRGRAFAVALSCIPLVCCGRPDETNNDKQILEFQDFLYIFSNISLLFFFLSLLSLKKT
jgi:hypothetical protein